MGVEHAAQDLGAIAYYGTLTGAYPKAGVAEEVKIFAHGNTDEIGEEEGAPSWTPTQLAQTLYKYLLPGNYKGKLSIDACGSGVMDNSRTTYVDQLYQALLAQGQGFTGTVWGYGGNVSGFASDEVVEAAGGDLPAGWMEIQARIPQ